MSAYSFRKPSPKQAVKRFIMKTDWHYRFISGAAAAAHEIWKKFSALPSPT